ncbi:MAG: antibiotic biosynthesis monooxygenase family protein [Candidatus Geothermincolia bacterium]
MEPKDLEEFKSIFDSSIMPAAKQQKGFRGALQLADPETGVDLTITFWETREDMMESEQSGFYQEQVAKVRPLLTEAPTRTYRESDSEVALAHVS